jgi:hypothetical protein
MSEVDLDISWLKNMYKETVDDEDDAEEVPCLMSSIKTCFLYVNLDSVVERVIHGSIDLEEVDGAAAAGDEDDGSAIISKESLYNLITCNQKLPESKRQFKVSDILLYCASNDDTNNGIRRITSVLKDVEIPAALPMYHNINSLIFVFTEKTAVTAPPIKLSTILSHVVPDEDITTAARRTRKRRIGKRGRRTRKM